MAITVVYAVISFAYLLSVVQIECGWLLRAAWSATPSRRVVGQDSLLRLEVAMLVAGMVFSTGDVWCASNESVAACI